MSLIPNYIQGASGKWHKNPIIWHKDSVWYICFDDDEPTEFVIKESKINISELRDYINDILNCFKIKATLSTVRTGAERCFGNSLTDYEPAYSVFMEFLGDWRLPDLIEPEWVVIISDVAYNERPSLAGVYHPVY